MQEPKHPVDRRRLLAGAGTAGALATAAALLPGAEPAAPQDGGPAKQDADGQAAGYRLTDHIQRYYRTARI